MIWLAHGSGIDDILLFVVPAALAILALRYAEARANKRSQEESEKRDAP